LNYLYRMNHLRCFPMLVLAATYAVLFAGCAAEEKSSQPAAQVQSAKAPGATAGPQERSGAQTPLTHDAEEPVAAGAQVAPAPPADTKVAQPAERKAAAPAEQASLKAGAAQPAAKKIRISRADDLPQHFYPFKGQLAEMVDSQEQFARLAAAVRADLEADLDKYEIDDAATLKRVYNTLVTIDVLEGRFDEALENIERLRQMEEKPALKLVNGIFVEALIAARRQVGPDAAADQYKRAFQHQFAARLAPLPWDVVQDEIQKAKGSTEIVSENLLKGSLLAHYQPVVDQTGQLNADVAEAMLRTRFALVERLPLKAQLIAAYQEKIAANRQEKPDIWAARQAALQPGDCSGQVLMAAWDSGTDPRVFKDILWENPQETADDADNDSNGYVDDIHGIAYDEDADKAIELLCPLGSAADRIPDVMKYIKGSTDLQAGIDSPEASALQQHLSGLAPADIKGFAEDLNLTGDYIHGTHVAGIMVSGNPCARLMIARLSYDYHMVPVPRTAQWGARDAAKDRDTVAYFQSHKVRVVNMSWGEALKDAERSLEANGIGANADERREMARQVFKLQRDALYAAIQNAPDILFVCAAGNSNSDVGFEEEIPSSFDLPNLIVVGAVDQAGEPTSFTSFGRTVQVYASGFEVESYVPGGQRMKLSGTSMASPAVANLAGKLIAIDPEIVPAAVVWLIKTGADEKAVGDHKILLINPQRTLELARERAKT
jgi:subtilisin family serine protease